jgi:phage shock protein A
MPGLLGKSVLEVAAADGIDVPWCVRVDGSPGSAGRLEALKAVVTQCLAAEPGGRPKVAALLDTVGDLLAAEVAEVGPGALDSEAQRVAETTALRDELAQARAQHASAVAALSSTVTGLESQLAAATARNAALEEATSAVSTRHAAEIAALQQAAAGSAARHASEVAALRATVSSLEASLTAHSADHEAQLAGAASRHVAEVAALREQHSKALAESVQQAQSRLAEATALHDADRAAWAAVEAQLRLQLARLESVSGLQWMGECAVTSKGMCNRHIPC